MAGKSQAQRNGENGGSASEKGSTDQQTKRNVVVFDTARRATGRLT